MLDCTDKATDVGEAVVPGLLVVEAKGVVILGGWDTVVPIEKQLAGKNFLDDFSHGITAIIIKHMFHLPIDVVVDFKVVLLAEVGVVPETGKLILLLVCGGSVVLFVVVAELVVPVLIAIVVDLVDSTDGVTFVLCNVVDTVVAKDVVCSDVKGTVVPKIEFKKDKS